MLERVIFPADELVVGFAILNGGRDVMLSIRRRDPWLGLFSGLGGNKEEKDLDICHTLGRESWEEAKIKVQTRHMRKCGEFEVIREGGKPKRLDAFIIWHFDGTPTKTEEMGPHEAFPIKNMPIPLMIPGDEHWVQWMLELKGERGLTGWIWHSSDLKTLLRAQIWECDPF